MSKVFLFDYAKCNGCRNCAISCKDEHCNQAWFPYSEPQPETGQFWMKIDETVRGSVPKVKVSYALKCCMHCKNAPCIEAAKNGAVYRSDNGLVIIDPAKAKGQRELVDACPYNAIYWNDELELPQKCTGCSHLLDDGWSVPRCVDACSTDALRFGEESEFADEIAQAEVLQPELGTSPSFYYLNVPKRFVAGEVYDEEADEVLIGARVTLATEDGSESVACENTDEFGDFWFKRVEAGKYLLFFEADGYATRTIPVDVSDEDCNIGSTALYQVNQ
jgi:Fe-S-cluster-containing dehydrogenase component